MLILDSSNNLSARIHTYTRRSISSVVKALMGLYKPTAMQDKLLCIEVATDMYGLNETIRISEPLRQAWLNYRYKLNAAKDYSVVISVGYGGNGATHKPSEIELVTQATSTASLYQKYNDQLDALISPDDVSVDHFSVSILPIMERTV